MIRQRAPFSTTNGRRNGRDREWRAVARKAGLKYVCDSRPGISRVVHGRGFVYRSQAGRMVRAPHQLAKIEALAIPPAWTEVWICPIPDGHLQATGRDDRGRKQYIYHEDWKLAVEEAKFNRLFAFGRTLPRFRAQVAHDLRRRNLSQAKVTALVAHLLDLTAIRIGNAEYARDNESYGLTTLHNRHVQIAGSTVEFAFRGKGGKPQRVKLHCPRLARLIRQCKEAGRPHLFQYLNGDGFRVVDSAAVNDYLHAVSPNVTAKDFRTWHATVRAAGVLATRDMPTSQRRRKRILNEAIAQAAELLGNTTTVCRKHYVHVGIAECYLAGDFVNLAKGIKRRPRPWMTEEEQLLLHILEQLQ